MNFKMRERTPDIKEAVFIITVVNIAAALLKKATSHTKD